jgi:carboxymethylenebutenolidase
LIAKTLLDRRTLLAGGLMLPGVGIAAKLAPPDVEVNQSTIHWAVGNGRELHGYMAIPAKARGRQPAVLVIGTPDGFARDLVKSVAQAGFVACTVNAAALTPDRLADDMRATAGWLANGRYGTGRVGAVGIDKGVDPVTALAASGAITAAVTFGDVLPATSTLVLSYRREGSGWVSPTEPDKAADWTEAWPHALDYLRGHLV